MRHYKDSNGLRIKSIWNIISMLYLDFKIITNKNTTEYF